MTPQFPPLRWLFIDMNSFFASCEQHDNPDLRGIPMIVVPMMTDATCAIAASYEAKAYGIKTGTPVWEAKARCPGLTIVMARHEYYVRIHAAIAAAIDTVIPVSARCSIDEFACHLMDNETAPDRARQIAVAVKAAIARIGPALTCSIGIGPNRWLAKMGTELEKPNGLVMLRGEDLPGPLLNLKLTALSGIGANMALRLERAGIYTVEALWKTSPKQLRAIMGGVGGERFWWQLHGLALKEDWQHDKSMVGHSRVLEPNLRPTPLARLVGRKLLCKAAARLRRYDLTAAQLSLSTRDVDGRGWYQQRRVTRTQDSFFLLKEYQQLWRAMDAEMKPRAVKKISVALSDLTPPTAARDLLAEAPAVRRTQLLPAMDYLNQRYGRDKITIGPLPEDRIETKIAFARIPELAEFRE